MNKVGGSLNDDLYIKDCGSYNTVINLNGNYKSHCHIDNRKSAELFKNWILSFIAGKFPGSQKENPDGYQEVEKVELPPEPSMGCQNKSVAPNNEIDCHNHGESHNK